MTRHLGFTIWFCLAMCGTSGGTPICDDVAIRSLSSQFKALEELVLKQQLLLARQERQLQDLSTTVALQQDKLGEQSATIAELEHWKHQQSIKDTIEDRPPAEFNEGGAITSLGSMSHSMDNVSETLRARRFVAGAEVPVAFHATMVKGVEMHIGTNQNIIFETVRLNLGNGYHVNHGLFVAPAPGIYIFSLSVMSYSSAHKDVFVAMVKNGYILATAYANGTPEKVFDQGSVSVVVQLATGDEVWVKDDGRPDMTIYGDDDTSFMGCLVIPL